MDLRKLYIASMSALAAFFLISCNNDEEETATLPYVDNTPAFTLDRYILAGSTHTMKAATVTNATGEAVTYSWSITRGSDTVEDDEFSDDEEESGNDGQELTFMFKGAETADTLCNFTVSCSVSATGYYGTSYSVTTTTVNGESLKSEGDAGLAEGITEGSCTDTEQHEYTTVKIGGLEWMAQNMASKGAAGAEKGAALENSDAVSGIFGRFYTWDEAKEICSNLTQDGGNEWRLPTRSDWDALGKYFSAPDGSEDGSASDGDLTVWKGITSKLMTNAKFNGNEMWEYWTAVGDISNESGFSIIPTGYATVVNMTQGDNSQTQTVNRIWTFFGMNEYAGFWTSDAYSNENSSGTDEGTSDGGSGEGDAQTPSSAYYVYMYDTRPDLMLNYADGASFALPVRCVRDAQ